MFKNVLSALVVSGVMLSGAAYAADATTPTPAPASAAVAPVASGVVDAAKSQGMEKKHEAEKKAVEKKEKAEHKAEKKAEKAEHKAEKEKAKIKDKTDAVTSPAVTAPASTN